MPSVRGISARVVTESEIIDGQYGDFRNGSRNVQEVIRKFLKANRRRGSRCGSAGTDCDPSPAIAIDAYEAVHQVMTGQPPLPQKKQFRRQVVLGNAAQPRHPRPSTPQPHA